MRIRKCIFGIIGGTVIVLIMAIVFYIEVWDRRSGLYKYEREQCTIYIDFDKTVDMIADDISNVTIHYSDGTEILAKITNVPDNQICLVSDNIDTFSNLGLPLELHEGYRVPGYIADNIEDNGDYYRYIIYYGSLSRIGFNTYKYKILYSYDNGRLDEKELIFKKVKK